MNSQANLQFSGLPLTTIFSELLFVDGRIVLVLLAAQIFFYVCTSFSNDIFVKPFEDGNCYGISTFYNVHHHILQILCAFF